MSHATLRIVSLALFGWAIASMNVSPASATVVIINDTFTAPDGTLISDHAPDVNLPGTDPNLTAGKYFGVADTDIGIGGGVGLSSAGRPIPTSNVARVGGDGGVAINLASRNAYAKPMTFTISADLNMEGMESAANGGGDPQTVGTSGAIGGIALGFYPGTSSLGGNLGRAILGVVYNDAGNLLLVKPSSAVSAQVVAVVNTYGPGNLLPIPTTGTHNLSYTVNTVTGAISSVMFDSLAVDFGNSFTNNLFTNTATTYAGWYSRSGSNNDYGFLDNFQITTEVPEPASLSLLSLGGLALLRRRRAH